ARLSQSLTDTAQQIWLAGVGAFARAQAESTKLFEGLVKEGLNLEKSALRFADTQAEVVRDVVETGVDSAAARATGTWEQLEAAVEGGVRRALTRLGVPDREELAELSRRVESLSAELRKHNGGRKAGAAGATRAAAPAKKATKRASKAASAARPASPAKTASKSANKPARKSATSARK
ncbi:MAG TPA: phasin family protein, partial [Lysobacter sp.]|nr:phasin family protein [Lysobacter sp.]